MKCSDFVTDGAWNNGGWGGAAAWVRMDSSGKEVGKSVEAVQASSAALVEVTAGIKALEWARSEGIDVICIRTDCLPYVQGFLGPEKCSSSIRHAILHFHHLCL